MRLYFLLSLVNTGLCLFLVIEAVGIAHLCLCELYIVIFGDRYTATIVDYKIEKSGTGYTLGIELPFISQSKQYILKVDYINRSHYSVGESLDVIHFNSKKFTHVTACWSKGVVPYKVTYYSKRTAVFSSVFLLVMFIRVLCS